MRKTLAMSAFAAVLISLTTTSQVAHAQVFINTPTVQTKVEPTFWNPNPQDGTGMDVYPQVWAGGGGRRGPYGPGPIGPGGPGGPGGAGPYGPGGIGGAGGFGTRGFGMGGGPFRPASGRGFGRR